MNYLNLAKTPKSKRTLNSKLTEWAKAKTDLVSLQKKLIMIEHEVKVKLMQEESAKKIEIMDKQYLDEKKRKDKEYLDEKKRKDELHEKEMGL